MWIVTVVNQNAIGEVVVMRCYTDIVNNVLPPNDFNRFDNSRFSFARDFLLPCIVP